MSGDPDSTRRSLSQWVAAHWEALAFAAIVVVFLGNSFIYFGWGQDDPGILFRYAVNLAEGRGLVYNPGERVEGFSDFGYVILMSVVYKALGLSGSPEELFVVSKFVGVVCSVLALWVTYAIASHFLRLERHWALFVCLMMAANSPFAIWSVGALETNCLVLVLLASLYLYLSYLRRRVRSPDVGNMLPVALSCGIGFSAVTLLRADAFVFAAIVGGHWVFCRLHSRNISRADWPIVVLPALTALGYEAWRLWYYGSPLPNTYYAKIEPSLSPTLVSVTFLRYLEPYLRTLGGTGLVAGLLAASVYKDKEHHSRVLALVCAGYIGYVLLIGGDWMAGYRFMVPVLPILLMLVVSGARHILRGLGIKPHRTRAGAAVCLLAAVLIAATQVYAGIGMIRQWKPQFAPWYKNPTLDAKQLVPYGGVADWIREHVDDTAVLATHQAGFVPFLTGLRTIDTFGITDRTLAHMAGDPAAYRKSRVGALHWLEEGPPSTPAEEYIVNQVPDLYMIYSRWNRRLANTAGYLAGGEYVLLESGLQGFDFYIPTSGTDKVLINVAGFGGALTSYSSNYDPDGVSGNVFDGGTWTSGVNEAAWIQADFEHPYMVEQISIEVGGTDITTEDSLIELMLLNVDDDFATVATLSETNVNWETASDGGPLNSVPTYVLELPQPFLAKAFRMNLEGNGWFFAKNIRVLGRAVLGT